MCDDETLRLCSRVLAGAKLEQADFAAVVKAARAGDFVHFDPPYVPLSSTSYFASYTKDGFGPGEQERLRDVALGLKRRGVHVLLSNSSAPFVKRLYGTGSQITIRSRGVASVSSASTRVRPGAPKRRSPPSFRTSPPGPFRGWSCSAVLGSAPISGRFWSRRGGPWIWSISMRGCGSSSASTCRSGRNRGACRCRMAALQWGRDRFGRVLEASGRAYRLNPESTSTYFAW
ncbi:MAG: DNA adenine methylase [Polyangiaceae bacterium]|nr:DNA adenine methylase [Polyangiaceae bacterium]